MIERLVASYVQLFQFICKHLNMFFEFIRIENLKSFGFVLIAKMQLK